MKFSQIKKICKDAEECIIYQDGPMQWIGTGDAAYPLEDVEAVMSTGDLEADAIKKERDRAVYACLQELSLQYRQVLALTYFEGFSVEEVGNIMSRSRKQVYNLLARAKASLKTSLEKVGITYEDL